MNFVPAAIVTPPTSRHQVFEDMVADFDHLRQIPVDDPSTSFAPDLSTSFSWGDRFEDHRRISSMKEGRLGGGSSHTSDSRSVSPTKSIDSLISDVSSSPSLGFEPIKSGQMSSCRSLYARTEGTSSTASLSSMVSFISGSSMSRTRSFWSLSSLQDEAGGDEEGANNGAKRVRRLQSCSGRVEMQSEKHAIDDLKAQPLKVTLEATSPKELRCPWEQILERRPSLPNSASCSSARKQRRSSRTQDSLPYSVDTHRPRRASLELNSGAGSIGERLQQLHV